MNPFMHNSYGNPIVRHPLIILVVVTALFSLHNAWASDDVHVVEHSNERIRLQVLSEIPTPEVILRDENPVAVVRVKDWPLYHDAEGHQLPYRPFVLHLSSAQAQVRILTASERRIAMPPPSLYEEMPIGADSLASAPTLPQDSYAPEDIVQLQYLGTFRQHHLWSARVLPYRYDAQTSELVVLENIVFDVQTPPSAAAPTQPINASDFTFLQEAGVVSATRRQAITPTTLAKPQVDSVERWKILVNEDGLYRITGADLEEAGVNLLDIDFRNIRLTSYDRDVSLFPYGWRDGQFDRTDYIEFWGEENRQTFQSTAPDLYQDPFSNTRVYWLSWEKRGLWMAEESGQIVDLQPGDDTRPYSFLESLHFEKDHYYDRLSSVTGDSLRDHWFWDTGISSGKKVDYPFTLTHPDDQSPLSVTARVMFRGRTTIVNVPHDVSVYLNDSYVVSHEWFGQDLADLQSSDDTSINGSDLNHGENRLSVVNNVSPQNYDFVMLNWFEITYPRLYRAHNDFIKFKIPPHADQGKFLFRIDGFETSDIQVYKLHQSKIVGGVIEEVTDFNNFSSLQISFQNDVFSPDVEFVAVSNAAKKKPVLIEEDEPSTLSSSQLAADYVVISHRRFIESPALEDLLDLRQSQGHRVLHVNVQDIYDEFNAGHPSSYAIRDFLKHAQTQWQEPKLQYVLLVGDGSYVRYDAQGDTLDLIPAHMRQTMVYGAAASDYWYSLLSGNDEIPELYIGRLPARTVDELELYIDKMIAYETSPPPGDWPNRFLIIGGNSPDFRSQGLSLSKVIPPQFDTRLLFTVKDRTLEVDPFFGGTSDLLDYLDQGCSVVTFHGHGGGAIWADNGLLRLEDVSRIYTEKKLPFFLSMTCFTGSFESPSRESLADALLFTDTESAVAIMGASGVGWTWNDYFLQNEIIKQIYTNKEWTLGEMIAAGKISYLAHYKTSQAVSQVNQYHLLGDPATRLVLPQHETEIQLDEPIFLKGDSVQVACDLPFANGTGSFDLEDSLKTIMDQAPVFATDNTANGILNIKNEFVGESGIIRFYGSDDFGSQRTHGAISISLKGAVFDSAYVYRSPDDSLYFYTHITSRRELNNVWCYALNDSLKMLPTENGWYRSERAVTVIWTGFQFSYYFNAFDAENRQYTSRLYKFYINLNVDVAVAEEDVRFVGDNHVYVQATINNNSSNDVIRLPVRFDVQSGDSTTWRTIGMDTVDITAYTSAESRVRMSPAPGDLNIRVTLDPDSIIVEDNKLNNRVTRTLRPHLFQVTPKGFWMDGQFSTRLLYDDQLTIEMPQAATSSEAVLLVKPAETVDVLQQPDFAQYPNTPTYDLRWITPFMALQKPATIWLNSGIDSTDTDSTLAPMNVYRFSRQTQKWLQCDSETHEQTLTATLPAVGQIAILSVLDSEAPDIMISIDGQPYVSRKWASKEPRIGIRLQDENGIDISPEKTRIVMDGKRVEQSEIALPDSIIDGNQIIISYNPQLLPGEHVLAIQATDCNQNQSEEREFLFRVANDFEIQMLGNYPNPFEEETRFAYIFTAPTEDMSLKIFTASGRLIRHIEPQDVIDDPNPLSADYHEVLWDGRDSEGFEVANGVYFYRLSATSDGNKKTLTGKLAKVK